MRLGMSNYWNKAKNRERYRQCSMGTDGTFCYYYYWLLPIYLLNSPGCSYNFYAVDPLYAWWYVEKQSNMFRLKWLCFLIQIHSYFFLPKVNIFYVSLSSVSFFSWPKVNIFMFLFLLWVSFLYQKFLFLL